MKSGKLILLPTMCLMVAIVCSLSGPAPAREITDMAGRTVTVPDVINKAYAPSPYGSTMLYSVAPDKLAGLMSPITDENRKFLNPIVYDLPVIGKLSNTEAMAKAKPDVIIVWADKKIPVHKKSEETLSKLKIPYVYVAVGDLADLPDYPAAYEFLGKLMGKEEQTARESAYCRKMLSEVEATMGKIPKSARPRVYLAEGADGLRTECDDSLHVHLLRLAGDVNIHRCHTSCHIGMEKVSLDQVKTYNPDVILVQDKGFFDKVMKDPAWSGIKAVKEGRVHLIPKAPFNWFDRPPSFMRILGLQWLMGHLYPNEYKKDLVKETRDFFRLFLKVDLAAEDAAKIMYQ